jgi:hypothetical protein
MAVDRLPFFPIERRTRLCVQTQQPGAGLWGDPQPATIEHLLAAVRELAPEQQATVARALGLVPQTVGERLARAEWVFDALSDAQAAIDRYRDYRKQFPEKRDGDVIDADFPEV